MSSRSSSCSASAEEGSFLSGFSERERERLSAILDRYLAALECGAPLAQDELLAENPDLADALRSYFRSLEELHNIAAGFATATQAGETATRRAAEGSKAIGDFELLREIGRGGMGVVYEARQISLDRRVAVKLLPFAAVLDARQVARFKHEAQAAAQIQHPNIVPVYAIGVERGVHYYAMQYIDGQPLDRAIEELRERSRGKRGRGSGFRVQGSGFGGQESGVGSRGSGVGSRGSALGVRAAAATAEYSVLSTEDAGRRSRVERQEAAAAETISWRFGLADKSAHFQRVAELGIQAAEALHAAHEFGVVHRDIKPSNLLLEASGKLWVTDFGLARFQRDASLTRTGDLVGTMRYMSPEQAAGQSALVDHRSDIYSLGVTLYELACLRPAFPEERGPALLKQIDSYDPPRPRQLQPGIPADLETVILKAMARDRDERYATAQALADDLRCILAGTATRARPPTLLDRVSRWARRRQRTVAASAIVLAVAVVGLCISTFLITRETLRANTAARLADDNYRQARAVLDKFGWQSAEELDDLPGAEQFRERLLREALAYYERFVAQPQSDPKLQLDIALTYGKLAALREQLGALDDAAAAHQQAVETLKRLSISRRGDPLVERQWALAENNLGLALWRTGQGAVGRESIERAIQRQKRLSARAPQSADVQADLGASLCNLGHIQQATGDFASARTSYGAAIEQLERVTSQRRQHGDERRLADDRKLAAAYNSLAGLCLASDPSESARLQTQALELLEDAAQAGPAGMSLRRELALTLHNLAASCSHAQQYPAAKAAYEQAVARREELVRWAPARIAFQTDLALSLNNLGLVEFRLNEPAAAEAAFRRAIELYEAASAQTPGDLTVASHLGGVYNNLGIALEKAGQLESAAESFRRAITVQLAVYEKARDLPHCRQSLSKHYENAGRVWRRLGQPARAQEVALARRKLHAGDGAELVRVAEELAAIAVLWGDSPDATAARASCAQLAAETRDEAIAAGYTPPPDSGYDGSRVGSERTSSHLPLTRPEP